MPVTFNLDDFVTGNLYGLMLLFLRLGSALMFFPGIGETFVLMRARLFLALGLSLLLLPVLGPQLPALPAETGVLVLNVVFEVTVGLFLGLIVRVMVLALEFAGQIISLQLGVGSAVAFNPALASQSSALGSLLGLMGLLLVFATNLHHVLLEGIVKSYALMPAASIPDVSSMSQAMMKTVAGSLTIAVMMAAPFIITTTLLQVVLGVLSRLQPSLQVFFLAMPLQILVGLALLMILFGSIMSFWLDHVVDVYGVIGLG